MIDPEKLLKLAFGKMELKLILFLAEASLGIKEALMSSQNIVKSF